MNWLVKMAHGTNIDTWYKIILLMDITFISIALGHTFNETGKERSIQCSDEVRLAEELLRLPHTDAILSSVRYGTISNYIATCTSIREEVSSYRLSCLIFLAISFCIFNIPCNRPRPPSFKSLPISEYFPHLIWNYTTSSLSNHTINSLLSICIFTVKSKSLWRKRIS
jgi:hypothetical protein